MPLDRKDPAGKTIDFFVKRVPAATQPARGQLWLLQGGPGLSGASLESIVPALAKLAPDLDVYLPDHRGVGSSSSLDCTGIDAVIDGATTVPVQADVVAAGTACRDQLLAKWGSLSGFNPAEAAADLGETIERTRTTGQSVFLWSTSYGTRWALRYLQEFPTQPSGVVLDSVESETASFTDFGAQLQAQSAPFLAACAADTFCNGKLGGNPTAFVIALGTKLDMGHCPTSMGLTKAEYRLLFGQTLTLPAGLRDALPALLFRVDRCNAGDQAAILNLRDLLAPGPAAVPPTTSAALNVNVTLSEIYDANPPSFATLVSGDTARLFSDNDGPFYRALYDVWPRYDASPYHGAYPTSAVPVLMLQGTLDPLTPQAEAEEVAAAVHGANQTLVLLQNGAHGSLFNTPTGAGSDCAASLLGQFVTDPTKALDTSCKSQVLAPDFANDGNAFLFGTATLWD